MNEMERVKKAIISILTMEPHEGFCDHGCDCPYYHSYIKKECKECQAEQILNLTKADGKKMLGIIADKQISPIKTWKNLRTIVHE